MGEQAAPAIVVQAWQDAANAQEIERLLELSDDSIEIAGPRGVGHGHRPLRDWLAHAGVQLQACRVYGRDDTIVVEQRAVWRAEGTGEVTGEADVASLFVVARGRVVRVARYESLAAALDAAGLSDSNQLQDG